MPADYLARNVNQSYDFSLTHTNSDFDVSRVELGLSFGYRVGERYLYHLGFGWAF